jgi:carboxyl-terminal processing protease
LLLPAVATCDLLISEGEIVRLIERGRRVKIYRAKSGGTIVDPELPVVVLINRDTASASEIVAACLQDHDRAVVIGQRSFGKGTVQEVLALEGGRSALKLTTAAYRRPSGKNIDRYDPTAVNDEWGVKPDPGFEVKLEGEQLDKVRRQRMRRDAPPFVRQQREENGEAEEPIEDPQLKKAIEYLKELLAQKQAA